MSLVDMIFHKLVAVDDTVFFTFKNTYFSAKILAGGLIGDCYMNRTGRLERILTSVTAFGSLTAWTESCLQDCLEEYYTRYSSWKRVSHKESKRSMGELREQCKLLSKKRKREDEVVELYKEVYRLQQTIVDMKQHITLWESGSPPETKKWEVQSIRPVMKKNKEEDQSKLRIQYIAMGLPRNMDLELYNIINT